MGTIASQTNAALVDGVNWSKSGMRAAALETENRMTAAETAITTEATNRTNADNAEITARNNAIAVETTRATAAEQAEITARIAGDTSSTGALGNFRTTVDDFGTLGNLTYNTATAPTISYSVNWTLNYAFQLARSPARPATYTAARATGSLTFAAVNNYANSLVGALLKAPIAAGRVIDVSAVITINTAPATWMPNVALVIGTTATAPVVGGTVAGDVALPSDFVGMCFLGGGTLYHEGNDGTTHSAAYTVTQTASFPYASGDTIRVVWTYGGSPSTASGTFYKNGVSQGTFTVAGLPTTGYIWVGFREQGTDATDSFVITNLQITGSTGASSLVASTNTILGIGALAVITTGTDNTAIGNTALASNASVTGLTAVGSGAMNANTSGTRNTAVGYQALNLNGIGYDCTAVGYRALASLVAAGGIGNGAVAIGTISQQNVTTGDQNTSVGSTAMAFLTTGSFNVGVGVHSMWNCTTATSNACLGHANMADNLAGSYNVAVGFNAMRYGTSGSNNTIVGFRAMELTTGTAGGSNNCAFGSLALFANTASNSHAFGNNALTSNTTGTGNHAFGDGALGLCTTGAGNHGLGKGALAALTTGGYNTGVGFQPLSACNGTGNIGIGPNVGQNLTSGTYNTFLGYQTALGITTGSNNTILGSRVSGLSAGLTGAIILAIGDGTIILDYNNTAASAWSFIKPLIPPKSTVAALPTGIEGMIAYSTNGRKVGEGAAAGTGVPVYFSNGNWRTLSADAAVAA